MRPASAISPFRSAPLRQALKEVPPTMKDLRVGDPESGAMGGSPVQFRGDRGGTGNGTRKGGRSDPIPSISIALLVA